MSEAIFLRTAEGLVEMYEHPYDREDELQRALADHPALLPGAQIDDQDPRRWILVQREAGVPHQESGGDRWSIDHLFVDQDGVPTLIEVKRSVDTRTRREVVGQMLDYAANAAQYWETERLIVWFEATSRQLGQEPQERLADLIGSDSDPDEFWSRVGNNLAVGRLRLVFVADRIPSELKAIVEFLNTQMERTEVLAVEVKQFVGEGRQTFVPRLIGQSERTRRKKKAGDHRSYEERLAEASADARAVEGLWIRIAAECGWILERKNSWLVAKTTAGEYVGRFEVNGAIGLAFEPLWEADPSSAERLLSELSERLSRIVPEKHPPIRPFEVLAHREWLVSSFVPKYVDARFGGLDA